MKNNTLYSIKQEIDSLTVSTREYFLEKGDIKDFDRTINTGGYIHKVNFLWYGDKEIAEQYRNIKRLEELIDELYQTIGDPVA